MTTRLIRSALLAMALGALLSCGGGGSGAVPAMGTAGSSVGSYGPPGGMAGGSADGAGGGTTAGGTAGGTSGGTAGGTAGGTEGAGAGDGSTSTASNGDGSGVGSGGTGVTAASAVGIGSVDGFGSVIVNGLRYAVDDAIVTVEDAPVLEVGMTARVTGSVDATFASGVASAISSAAELRGPVTDLDLANGTLRMMGTTVTTDDSTVWAGSLQPSSLASGATLQVWGLPVSPGVLRATRIATVDAGAAPIVTGPVQDFDSVAQVFRIGGLVIDYRLAAGAMGGDGARFADGAIVRVRATQAPVLGVLQASVMESWYGHASTAGAVALLEGVIDEYVGPGAFRILGTPVDASTARITGGPGAGALGNGVKVIVGGTFDANGRLVATTVKIRHIPGTGGPASFMLIGTVGSYVSLASFRVRGQPVDASNADVVFENGGAGALRNGAKVTVSGARVVEGVLIATQVGFD